MPRREIVQENENTGGVEGQQLPFEVMITEHNPESGVLAYADVKIGSMLTVRNVKIRKDDYGLTVTMPRTRIPYAGQYKDSVYFAEKAMKDLFDQAVSDAYYQTVQEQNLSEECTEQNETLDMSMGM